MTIKLNLTLKRLLKDNDLTASQLSRATKIPVQSIHNWIHGQTPRSFEQIKKIADYFQITVDALVYGDSSPVAPRDTLNSRSIDDFTEEINAGVFEVVLRRIKKV
ncbi:MAG: helix-turn-helix transcriptional regulator [Bacteriovorax sp.]|jgi:transcriptional regulator with XRE-family HTH domain